MFSVSNCQGNRLVQHILPYMANNKENSIDHLIELMDLNISKF